MRGSLVLLLAGIALSADAKEDPAVPEPPLLVILDRIDTAKALAEHRVTTMEMEPKEVTKTITRDGKAFFVKETVHVPVTKVILHHIGLRDSKFFTPTGKELPLGEALNKLKAGSIVAISQTGGPLHTSFARVLRDDVIVIADPRFLRVPAIPVPPPPAPKATDRFRP